MSFQVQINDEVSSFMDLAHSFFLSCLRLDVSHPLGFQRRFFICELSSKTLKRPKMIRNPVVLEQGQGHGLWLFCC